MSCVRMLPAAQRHLVATTTTDQVEWCTEWLPAMAMDAATATLKFQNVSGNLRARPVMQTAEARTDKPDAATAVGTAATTAGEYFFSTTDFNLSAVTAGKTFVRFGFAYSVSAGSLGQADAQLQVAVRQCGHLLPAWSGHLMATSTQKVFQPVTGWMPALGVTKIEGTVVITGLSGLELKLTYRTATASPELPGTWDTTGVGTLFTTDTETNDGEQPVTTTNKMLIQAGFFYYAPGGSFGQADVSVAIGVRSS